MIRGHSRADKLDEACHYTQDQAHHIKPVCMQPTVKCHSSKQPHNGRRREDKCDLAVFGELRPNVLIFRRFLFRSQICLALRIIIPLLGCGLVAFNQIADAPGILFAMSMARDGIRPSRRVYAYVRPENARGNLHRGDSVDRDALFSVTKQPWLDAARA